MNLENKVFLITGGSKGIGEAIAYSLSGEKAKLILTFNNDSESCEQVKSKCLELGATQVEIVELNLLDNESIKKLNQFVVEKTGHVDYLINNAGVISWERFENETFDEIENQIRINLEGLIKVTSILIPSIKEGIVNMASRAGHLPFSGRAAYTASKFGVIGFTKSLALEYSDLRIFSVSPSAVKTQMWNFKEGVEPEIVAEYLVKALKNEIELKDGDLNLWEILK